MSYRYIILVVLAAALFGLAGWTVAAQDDMEGHRRCVHCGMDRKAYGYSRMLVVYEDGAQVGICSLHCAVTELDANKSRKVKSLLVADRDTRRLIDAEKATWVMGGSKRGVMTSRPKWAFETKAAAEAFILAHGGEIVRWEISLATARGETASNPRQIKSGG